MRKVCVVTSSRAEYGVLKGLMTKIDQHPQLELILFVTGSHLVSEFGNTFKFIEDDGFKINEKIHIQMFDDSEVGIAKTMGLAFLSFGEIFYKYKLDMLIVLGDRYELLPICSTANIYNIPIVHISGGETTEGAIDEFIRHSITKMSHFHFPGNSSYRKRVIQLGEHPDRVFNYGDIGVEMILQTPLKTKKEVLSLLSLPLEKYVMVIYHPSTLNQSDSSVDALLRVIEEYHMYHYIFIKSNADSNNKKIINSFYDFVNSKSNCYLFDSVKYEDYLSLLKHTEFILGNSSSGIIEAPALNTPTINIGDRQKGRMFAKSVISINNNYSSIKRAFEYIVSTEFKHICDLSENPYEYGKTTDKIIEIIIHNLDKGIDIKKKFYDVEFEI